MNSEIVLEESRNYAIFCTMIQGYVDDKGFAPSFIRIPIAEMPLWYVAVETGFELVAPPLYDKLEKAYHAK